MPNLDLTNKVAWGGAGINPTPQNPEEVAGEMSFNDLMSETLAIEMQKELDGSFASPAEASPVDESDFLDAETKNDLMLAQMLQYEFDREYDQQIDREEKHLNKNCKLGVSYDKYKICPSWYGEDPDDTLKDIDDENRCIDVFEECEKEDPTFPPWGYVKNKNQEIITKHDKAISGRKNAKRVMNFPPGFNTGDGGGFEMKLDNKVYNNLHKSAINENKRLNRFKDKVEKATADLALDRATKGTVYQLTNNGTVGHISGNISTGKESVVYLAEGKQYENIILPEQIVMKVFKTSLTSFKNREIYINADYRFKNRISKNSSKAIKLWAEKEFHNLRRLNRAGIPSPEAFLVRDHILVMSFIGVNGVAAPKLKQIVLGKAGWENAYNQVVKNMVAMYHSCNLIHADLNEYNILWLNSECYFIDLGQSVEPVHPNALKFLLRDCNNIIKFFDSKHVPNLPTAAELFTAVSHIDLPQMDIDHTLNNLENGKMTQNEGNNDEIFQYFWQKILEQQSNVTPPENRDSSEGADDEEEEEEEKDIVHEDSSKSPRTKKKNRRREKKEKNSPPVSTD